MFSKNRKFLSRFSAGLWSGSMLTLGFFSSVSFSAEKSLVNIKQVQVSESDRVDILLDGKLDSSQVRTEYLNDIIQLSLSDASVYPARISSVSGKDLSKIFIYQYAPRLVRVRLSVKGKAESFQGKVQVKPSGKLLTIRLGGAGVSDKLPTSAAQAKKDGVSASAARADSEERALLEKVLKAPVANAAEKPVEKSAATAEAASEKPKSDEASAAESVVQKTTKRRESRSESLTGRKESFSPVRMLGSLLGVVLLLGACLFGLKRLATTKNRDGAVGRWVRKSLGRPEKIIEVVATHHLGPKKSIHMVKVAGRTLVLGVADDSINLITELNSALTASTVGNAATSTAGEDDFLSTLGEQIAQESGRSPVSGMGAGATVAGPAAYQAPRPTPGLGARDRIRNRLEGMKQL